MKEEWAESIIFEPGKKGGWEEVARFESEDGASSDWFGWAVDVDGGTAVIGAWEDSGQGKNQGVGEGPGFVYIYSRKESE